MSARDSNGLDNLWRDFRVLRLAHPLQPRKMDAYKKWWTEAGEKDIKMLHQYTNSFKLYAAEGIAK